MKISVKTMCMSQQISSVHENMISLNRTNALTSSLKLGCFANTETEKFKAKDIIQISFRSSIQANKIAMSKIHNNLLLGNSQNSHIVKFSPYIHLSFPFPNHLRITD